MTVTARDLYEITSLNGDAVNGFLAQVKNGTRCTALWPEHLTGSRWNNWMEGCNLAKQWMAMRRGYQISRRKHRAHDFATQGGTGCLLPTPSERREEQLECLRFVWRSRAGSVA